MFDAGQVGPDAHDVVWRRAGGGEQLVDIAQDLSDFAVDVRDDRPSSVERHDTGKDDAVG